MSAPQLDNERGGMPSGSGAERWTTCPGSHLAEQGQPDTPSDDAAEGEMLHAVVAGLADGVLSDEQQWCVDFCRQTRDRLCHEVLGEPEQTTIEERFWLRDEILAPVASCRVDHADHGQHAILALDWKFGRRGAPAADVNAQLRFTAAVLWQEFSPDVVYVGIVAPRVDGERVTLAKFTAEQCRASHAEMVAAAKRAMLPGQPRNPSPKACHYCKARATCPEAIAAATALSVVDSAELADPIRVAQLLDRCDQAERVIDAIRDGAKRMIEAGVAVPGWKLKPGSKVKKVAAQAAWAKVGQQIGGASFAEACTVSIPKLASGWKGQHPELSEKSARAAVESMLGDAVTETQNAPSLSREAA